MGWFNRAFFWTDERTTLPYDLWVIAILAFVWLTPPDWLGDPTASGPGLIGSDRQARRTAEQRYAPLSPRAACAAGFARRSTFADFFFVLLTASRLFLKASIRLTTLGGASTVGATISSPAIFASMIRCSPSRYSSL